MLYAFLRFWQPNGGADGPGRERRRDDARFAAIAIRAAAITWAMSVVRLGFLSRTIVRIDPRAEWTEPVVLLVLVGLIAMPTDAQR